jgi:methionyl-tRNA synthetase
MKKQKELSKSISILLKRYFKSLENGEYHSAVNVANSIIQIGNQLGSDAWNTFSEDKVKKITKILPQNKQVKTA